MPCRPFFVNVNVQDDFRNEIIDNVKGKCFDKSKLMFLTKPLLTVLLITKENCPLH